MVMFHTELHILDNALPDPLAPCVLFVPEYTCRLWECLSSDVGPERGDAGLTQPCPLTLYMQVGELNPILQA